MRRHVLLVAMLACAGCAGQPGWVPDLVLRARVVQRVGETRSGPRAGWGWQVHGGVRWRLARAPRPVEEEPAEPRRAPAWEMPCIELELCAWEHQQRERAYEAALRRMGAPSSRSGEEEP